MSLLNDNDNKLNLLFKSLQGKTQARPDVAGTSSSNVPYFSETVKGLKNIYQEDIFAESFPSSLPSTQTVSALFNNPSIPESSWNTNVYDQSLSIVDLSDSLGNPLPLKFYKSVYLNQPVANTPQSWWLLNSSSADAIPENNVLRSMIPFGYDGKANSTFQPIVEYFNGSNWVPDSNQGSAGNLGWLIDYPTGVLQLYQDDTTLSTYDITSPLDNVEKGRPRISFIKYTGTYGTGGGGGGGGGTAGLFKVGELSGNTPQPTQDVSAMYFDKDDFDISFVSQTARISFIDSGYAKVSDLSYYFFDVPNDLSGTGDLSINSTIPTPFIELFIDPPPQTKAALPFGKTLQYKNASGAESEEYIKFLPFFKELKVQVKNWNIATPSGYLDGWIDIGINNTSPQQSFIPPTIRNMKFSYGATDISLLNTNGQITNPPFTEYRNFTDLSAGGNYQFRLYLTNDGDEPGIVDPVYGNDVSYNYLYIPEVSGQGILLGAFSRATAPTDLSFIIQQYNTFTLGGINNDPSGADASGNVPFPINPLINYQVFFGVDISQTPVPAGTALQMPNIRNNITDASYIYETPSQLVKTWSADDSVIGIPVVYPETEYRATFHYMRNNTADFSATYSYQTPSADVSYTTGIPLRGPQSGAVDGRMPASGNLSFSASGLNTTQAIPITSGSTPVYDVYFLTDSSTVDFNVGNLPSSFANNKVTLSPDISFAGRDSSGIDLTYLQFSSSGTAAGINYDASTNKTKGYLDVSNISIQNGDTQFFDLSASTSEGGDLLPLYTKRGYYTDISINGAIVTDVSLVTYPDICNNNYNPYEVKITDYYNGGTGTFVAGNDASGELFIGRKPPNNISYGENTYTNPTVSLLHNFFGLKMPDPRSTATPASVTYTYDLSQIALWWKPNTTTIAKATLEYDPAGSTYDVDNLTKNWPSNTEVPQIIVDPTLELKANTWTKDGTHSRKYSRAVADITFTGRQFQIKTEYNGNVSYWGGTDYDTTVTRDVSFGTPAPGKYLWWDTTWSTSGTQTTPAALPEGFFSGGTGFQFIPAVGENGWSGATTYIHTVSTPNNQLMWANGGFRGANTSGSNDPYIDFTQFYNPGGVLQNYAPLASAGDTNQASNYSGTGGNKVWWSGTGVTGVNRTLKYITFNVNVPYTDSISGTGTNIAFTLSGSGFSKDSNPSGSANGCWVFHNESANGTTAGPFDGQGQQGVGVIGFPASYESGPGGYRINTPSSNNSGVPGAYQTILQISIGIPNNLTTNLSSITVGFTKY